MNHSNAFIHELKMMKIGMNIKEVRKAHLSVLEKPALWRPIYQLKIRLDYKSGGTY